MKKTFKFLKWLLLIFLLINLGQFFQKKQLILTNFENVPISNYSKENLIKVGFYIKDLELTSDEIKSHFPLCDSLIICSEKSTPQQYYNNFGEFSPLFSYEINTYFFYTKITNETFAGVESLFSETYYIWTPWKWYLINNMETGGA